MKAKIDHFSEHRTKRDAHRHNRKEVNEVESEEREMIETVYHHGIDTVIVVEPKRTPEEYDEWRRQLKNAVTDFMRAVYDCKAEQARREQVGG